MAKNPKLEISVVVPVYNGSPYLRKLVAEIDEVRNCWDTTSNCPLLLTEAIFVVDDAIDDSEVVLNKLADEHSWVKVFVLSRNFGQHAATEAGMLRARGEWIISMDEDLQHQAKDFESMLRLAIDRRADVVYACGRDRIHGGFRDLSSRLVKRVIAWLSDNQAVITFSSFRLIRGAIARGAASVCTQETYFDVALGWYTCRIHALEVDLVDRRYITQRESGYNYRRLLSHFRRLIVSSKISGLRLAAGVGLLAVLVSGVLLTWVLWSRFVLSNDSLIQGWASLAVMILFFGGITVSLLSIAHEYLAIMIRQQLGQPHYFFIDRSNDLILAEYFASKSE